jgi:putative restriction endonuclease
MTPLPGTIAITDRGWYERLRLLPHLDEVNFWKPSATRAFRAPEFSPFLFKLRAPDNAICGFGYFARYSKLPDWLAWEAFGEANGCSSLADMRERIGRIREGFRFRGSAPAEIGCVLLVQPVLFPRDEWVATPRDWPARTQATKLYDLSIGEGARVWADCLRAAERMGAENLDSRRPGSVVGESSGERFGAPSLVRPRLGQGTFRIAVTDAYGRGCAISGEHSLPALEAAHIRPYRLDGPHALPNGLLLRADLHRLFDTGYLTVSPEHRVEISSRLREDFENGRSYYPFHGEVLREPEEPSARPSREYLDWHNQNVYLG